MHIVGVKKTYKGMMHTDEAESLVTLVAGEMRFRAANRQPGRQGSWPQQLSPISF